MSRGVDAVNVQEVRSQSGRRSPGAWEGEVWMAGDGDETPEESIDEWYSDVASQ